MPALDQGDPFLIDVGVDARAVAFTLATASFTAMIFGLFPAVRGTAPRFVSGLQEAGRRVVGGAHRVGATGALVSAQIALSLILVSIAGLLTATVRNLDRVSPGFDPSNLLLFRIDPTLNGYEGSRLTALYGALLERIRAVPGVASATVSAHTLIANSGSISEVYLPGDGAGEPAVSVGSERRAASRRRPLAWRQAIDDEYFRTMSIPVLAGRTFDHGETVQSRKAAMVNSTFVRQVLDGRDPIGRRFSFSGRPNAPEYEIVGVVGDARISSIRDDVPVTVYVSYRQHAPGAMTFEVRTTGDPLSIVPSVRQAVSEADPNVPMFDVRTQAMQIAHSLRREHLFARLATMLSLVTLLLSGIGLYGLLAHWVTRRTAEIGVRMALGAARATVRWMVLRQSILLVILGLAVGVPAALAGSQLVRSLLFGLNPTDPVTIAGAAGLLVLVALAAAYLPARRASCVDPMVALRQL
jgi:predicted permease